MDDFIIASEDDVVIGRAENGFVVVTKEYSNDGNSREVMTVIEEIESEDGIDAKQYAIQRLLYEVADHFGIIYNKFDKNNLDIKWDKKGHKTSDEKI